ncbi:MAG: pyridoxal phosphate-dependent aminotransferase [Clostridiales bacterium]|nr:pyridoxal phosphate-dependent aminotransferase [Clostridiales bacterium]
MIAKRMEYLVQNSSVIRAMFEEGKVMAKKYGAENVYDFSIGNPNYPPPPAIKQAFLDILNNEDELYVHGYMSNAGFESVREAVAQSLNRRFGTSFTMQNIVMTCGAAGGINVALKVILNPGDEVIVLPPYFVDYGNYVRGYDGVIVTAPTRASDFQPDPETLRAAITPKTKALIVNSPNNPTGVIYTEESIRAMADVLFEKQREYGTSIYIISDEPYRDLAYDGLEVPYITKFYPNTIVCYSWSKSLSLPGERIGYLAVPSEADDFERLMAAASVATRVLGFINAPSIMQLVVAKCLEEKANIAAYDANRRLLYDGLRNLGYEPVMPQGAFYMWVKAPGGDDKAFTNKAKEHRILVVPGASFGYPGYFRIAYCVAKETIERSLPAFEALARELGLI